MVWLPDYFVFLRSYIVLINCPIPHIIRGKCVIQNDTIGIDQRHTNKETEMTTRTPKYTVNINDTIGYANNTFAWDYKNAGHATDKNLAAWVEVMNASFGPGGVNENIGLPEITKAAILYNGTETIVAEYGY